MKYYEDLIRNANKYEGTVKPHKTNNELRVTIEEEYFTGKSLSLILSYLKEIWKYRFIQKYTLTIDLGEIVFSDKITYLMLEIVILLLLERTSFKVRLVMLVSSQPAVHNGLKYNSIIAAQSLANYIDKKTFIKNFYSNKDTPYAYRRFISREAINDDDSFSSKKASDILFLLDLNFTNDIDWNEGIAEAISELLDNAATHSCGDILLDVDICEASRYEQEVRFLNIAIITLDENLLYSRIMEYLKGSKYYKDDPLYSKIYEAYDYHAKHFDDFYTEEHYFILTAFQNHVTSRELVSGSNGTGLTKLIEKILSTTTEDDYSYVLSGNHLLFFRKGRLVRVGGFIGFNETGDYLNNIPADDNYAISSTFVPGTVYNLQLIKEREDE